MPGHAGPKHLLGRRREQQMLAGLLGGAREGHSGVLVIRGEAGIGKTALVTELVDQATDFRVIHTSGAESEMEFTYAGVHQLCAPLVELRSRLPTPQRNALEVALGLSEGDAPDGFLVRLAVLTLLGEAGADRPTICVIDDTQWVDRASRQTLAFVARRMLADPVVMLFCVRDSGDDDDLAGLPELALHGLEEADARALLAAMLPGKLNERTQEIIISESRGNPLALLELHRALTPAELAGGYGLAKAKSTASRIERTFGRRLHDLPTQTRTLLLLAAAESSGESSWLWAAADHLDICADAAAPAEAAGLITIDGSVRFRHPLVRSAIYANASLSERRQAHGALAQAISGQATEDHRAWHLAHASAGPDEQIAEGLVLAAERARARGGVAAAAAFLSHAVDLTPEPDRRAKRAFTAAQTAFDAGDPNTAGKLLTLANGLGTDEFLSARVDLLRAKLAFAARRGRDAPALLIAAAKRLRSLDPLLARETYLEALLASIIVGRLSTGPDNSAPMVAREARDAPPAPASPRAIDLLLDGLIVRLIEGHVAAAPLLKRAMDEYLLEEAAGSAVARWHDITSRVSLDLFDQDTYASLTARQLESIRATGALTLLPIALSTYAGLCVTSGRFSQVAEVLEEADLITTATGAPMQRLINPYLAAYRGQEHLCREHVRATIEAATSRGEGIAVAVALYSAAILHNGLGQYAEALTAAITAADYDDIGMCGWALVEAVEAASRCGESTVAADAVRQLLERADASGTQTALGIAARSKALVSSPSVAEDEYRRAIAHLERSPVVVHWGRSHLIYGEWLRRNNRRADARTELRTAYDMFVQIGADGFAERARRELRATGESVLRQPKGAAAGLTTQESYITRLAREGYTNSEIAAQLFISPRTVEWHLGKIFAKLGVTSRRELRKLALELP